MEYNKIPCAKKFQKEESCASALSSARTPTRREDNSENILMNERLNLYKSLHQMSEAIATEDPIDLFFKSIAAQVKGLPPQIVPDLRMKITSMVCECEKATQFSYRNMTSYQQHQEQNLYYSNFL